MEFLQVTRFDGVDEELEALWTLAFLFGAPAWLPIEVDSVNRGLEVAAHADRSGNNGFSGLDPTMPTCRYAIIRCTLQLGYGCFLLINFDFDS